MIRISVSARGFPVLRRRLEHLPRRMIRAQYEATKEAVEAVAAKARENVFTRFRNEHGGANRIADAIKTRVTRRGNSVFGTIYIGPDPRWAALFETGGTIHHPGSDRFQVFQGRFDMPTPEGRNWRRGLRDIVFTHYTRPHEIPMPARPYLRPAAREMRGEVSAIYRENIFAAARRRT